jgi:hypothetical protein
MTELNGSSAKAAVRQLDVSGVMKFLPEASAKKVVRALLKQMSGSSTLLQKEFGITMAATASAVRKVNLALAMSAEFEQRSLSVSSTLTNEGQTRQQKRDYDGFVRDVLKDEHGGGRVSLLDKCLELDIDLKTLIEESTAEQDSLDYTDQGVGASAVNKQRSDARSAGVILRQNGWENIAARVEAHVQAVQQKKGNSPPFTVSTTCVRRYCFARHAGSAWAKECSGFAEVNHGRVTSKAHGFNIDGHHTHAGVRMWEECYTELAAHALFRYWDDHAKFEADKKRGYGQNATVKLMKETKVHPYSDMGAALGGGKVVTNSILVYGGSAADGSGPRGMGRDQQAYAVSRLEHERRSTPVQQLNDWWFLQESDDVLRTLVDSTALLFSLSDGGWDHQVRHQVGRLQAPRVLIK